MYIPLCFNFSSHLWFYVHIHQNEMNRLLFCSSAPIHSVAFPSLISGKMLSTITNEYVMNWYAKKRVAAAKTTTSPSERQMWMLTKKENEKWWGTTRKWKQGERESEEIITWAILPQHSWKHMLKTKPWTFRCSRRHRRCCFHSLFHTHVNTQTLTLKHDRCCCKCLCSFLFNAHVFGLHIHLRPTMLGWFQSFRMTSLMTAKACGITCCLRFHVQPLLCLPLFYANTQEFELADSSMKIHSSRCVLCV